MRRALQQGPHLSGMLILLGAEACAPLLILTRAELARLSLVKGSLMPLRENLLSEQMTELIRNHGGWAALWGR